ncbi:MAG: DUF2169 domain-containing protein [Gammaproteobacteria bacterium]|nr:DUF2169 domain-containing protein [Gammaproteobacteria bacterium]
MRDKNGAEVWLVAVKATFSIDADGTVSIAEEQEEVNIAPKFRGAPDCSSLLYDTDLPHLKKNTDVLIEGHAYTPQGRPAKKVDVGFKVAKIQKILRIIGDRQYVKTLAGITLSSPQAFIKMPITYERAYGGTDLLSDNPKHHAWEARNPIGCGFATKGAHLAGKTVPNIEDPKALIGDWKQRPRPAGFGPIAGHWSPRVELAGTYDENWEETRQPLLAEDFDERYYQCAPEDQQVAGYLKGGEQVDLYNLTPHGHLQFFLPRLSLSFTTNFDDGSSEQHRAVIHTVTIKPDDAKVVVVWHTHLECHHKVLKLTSTSIRIKKRILLSEQGKAAEIVV